MLNYERFVRHYNDSNDPSSLLSLESSTATSNTSERLNANYNRYFYKILDNSNSEKFPRLTSNDFHIVTKAINMAYSTGKKKITGNARRRKEYGMLLQKLKKQTENLNPLIIDLKYNFHGRNVIVTPRGNQFTQEYIKRTNEVLHFADSFSSSSTQCSITDRPASAASQTTTAIAPHLDDNTSAVGQCLRRKRHSDKFKKNCHLKQLPHDTFKCLFKSAMNSELVNGTFMEQTRGNKSKLKQVALPGKVVNQARATVLPGDHGIRIDEIALPEILYNTVEEYVNAGQLVITMVRQPILSTTAVRVFTKISKTGDQCVRINPLHCKCGNIDFDGDCVMLTFHTGEPIVIELILRLHPNFKVVRGFQNTLIFEQPTTVRMALPRYESKLLYPFMPEEGEDCEKGYCQVSSNDDEKSRLKTEALQILNTSFLRRRHDRVSGPSSPFTIPLSHFLTVLEIRAAPISPVEKALFSKIYKLNKQLYPKKNVSFWLEETTVAVYELLGNYGATRFMYYVSEDICFSSDPITQNDICGINKMSLEDETLNAIVDSGTTGSRQMLTDMFTWFPYLEYINKYLTYAAIFQDSQSSVAKQCTDVTRNLNSSQDISITPGGGITHKNIPLGEHQLEIFAQGALTRAFVHKTIGDILLYNSHLVDAVAPQ